MLAVRRHNTILQASINNPTLGARARRTSPDLQRKSTPVRGSHVCAEKLQPQLPPVAATSAMSRVVPEARPRVRVVNTRKTNPIITEAGINPISARGMRPRLRPAGSGCRLDRFKSMSHQAADGMTGLPRFGS